MTADAPADDEYTDEALLGQQIELGDATYEATSVDTRCVLTIVAGDGPATRDISRGGLVSKVATALGSP